MDSTPAGDKRRKVYSPEKQILSLLRWMLGAASARLCYGSLRLAQDRLALTRKGDDHGCLSE